MECEGCREEVTKVTAIRFRVEKDQVNILYICEDCIERMNKGEDR